MKTLYWACLVASLLLIRGVASDAKTPETEDRFGLRRISGNPFLVPDGSTMLAECDFETGAKLPPGWSQGNAEVMNGGDAPQGTTYLRMKAKKSAGLRSPVISAQPGLPYFLSFWVKTSADPWTTISFTSDEREPSFTKIHSPFFYPESPLDMGDQWRQGGFYFVMPVQCKTVEFNISPREDGADGQFVCLDNVCLRYNSTPPPKSQTACLELQRGPATLQPRELGFCHLPAAT